MTEVTNTVAARLADKVAVITGAGRGIGRAMAELFASQGAAVVVVDVTAETANDTLTAINGRKDCMAVVCDISDSKQVTSLFSDVEQRCCGRVHRPHTPVVIGCKNTGR